MTSRFAAMILTLLVLGACSEPASEASSRSAKTASNANERPVETVRIGDETFELELAVTPTYRNRGLMYRTTIAPKGGMLFVFPEPYVQSFWMANCLVDIDIIYLDPENRVTAVHRMKVEDPRRPNETDEEYRERMAHYSSRIPAQFVIELAGGTLDRLSLQEGDVIELDSDRLRAMAE